MTESVAKRPRHAPTHPGAIPREDVLPALGIGVTEMARHLQVTRQFAPAIEQISKLWMSEQLAVSRACT